MDKEKFSLFLASAQYGDLYMETGRKRDSLASLYLNMMVFASRLGHVLADVEEKEILAELTGVLDDLMTFESELGEVNKPLLRTMNEKVGDLLSNFNNDSHLEEPDDDCWD